MSERSDNPLGGTTLRVYRYLYKTGKPLGIHDVQRGLGLSSASLAEYHLKKLLRDGLIREDADGYVVDRVMFENMVRLGRWVLPFQAAYVAFFVTTLIVMITVVRPEVLTSSYVFAVIVNLAALAFSAYETLKASRLVYRD